MYQKRVSHRSVFLLKMKISAIRFYRNFYSFCVDETKNINFNNYILFSEKNIIYRYERRNKLLILLKWFYRVYFQRFASMLCPCHWFGGLAVFYSQNYFSILGTLISSKFYLYIKIINWPPSDAGYRSP